MLRIPKTLLMLIGSSVLLAFQTATAAGGGAEQKAALASFQDFLTGLGKRDKAGMMATVLPGGSVTLMRNGKPMQMTLDALVERLAQPGSDSREERIKDALVRVDEDVAIVWAPFEFLANGKIDHCGRDVASLVKVDGKWIIASIVDNGRNNCSK